MLQSKYHHHHHSEVDYAPVKKGQLLLSFCLPLFKIQIIYTFFIVFRELLSIKSMSPAHFSLFLLREFVFIKNQATKCGLFYITVIVSYNTIRCCKNIQVVLLKTTIGWTKTIVNLVLALLRNYKITGLIIKMYERLLHTPTDLINALSTAKILCSRFKAHTKFSIKEARSLCITWFINRIHFYSLWTKISTSLSLYLMLIIIVHCTL